MAHTKATGSGRRTVDVAGKRLGIKRFGGEHVISGNIIVRQRGTQFYPGLNTDMGRDHTIFAVAEGFVSFRPMTGKKQGQKYIDVLPQTVAAKVETVKVKSEATVADKPKRAAKPKAKKTA